MPKALIRFRIEFSEPILSIEVVRIEKQLKSGLMLIVPTIPVSDIYSIGAGRTSL